MVQATIIVLIVNGFIIDPYSYEKLMRFSASSYNYCQKFILLVFDGKKFPWIFILKEEMFANLSLYEENTKCPYCWNSNRLSAHIL
jgi:hypothetical protein